MTKHLQPGDTVYVPYNKVDPSHIKGSAFFSTKVHAVNKRSVCVDKPSNHAETIDIASALVHRRIGVAIVRLGDYDSEVGLLDLIASSLNRYFKILLDSSEVRVLYIRSLAELRALWKPPLINIFGHVILIGHGSPTSVMTLVDNAITPIDLANAFSSVDSYKYVFTSLCCETGIRSFAMDFSKANQCEAFIAPFHTVHGAAAVQFCINFHTQFLLTGKPLKPAYKWARTGLPTGISFRLWKDGKINH